MRDHNDRMPENSRMQIELVVSSLAADFARVMTLQYANSVGQRHDQERRAQRPPPTAAMLATRPAATSPRGPRGGS